MDPHASRYAKQILFHGIGAEGQVRLGQASVLVAGCGALGTALVEGLVRAGVGRVRLVDRDFVDLSNLQRQVLFDEDDVARGLPKAVAAANKLGRINHEVTVEPLVTDIGPDNVLGLFQGMDLVLDGLDNFETRFLLNDASLETGIQPILSAITALQLVNAFKLLVGRGDEIEPVLTLVDVWENSHRKLRLGTAQERQSCPACGLGQRDWLKGERVARSSVLCGRNAVQISPAERLRLSLDDLANRLAPVSPVIR